MNQETAQISENRLLLTEKYKRRIELTKESNNNDIITDEKKSYERTIIVNHFETKDFNKIIQSPLFTNESYEFFDMIRILDNVQLKVFRGSTIDCSFRINDKFKPGSYKIGYGIFLQDLKKDTIQNITSFSSLASNRIVHKKFFNLTLTKEDIDNQKLISLKHSAININKYYKVIKYFPQNVSVIRKDNPKKQYIKGIVIDSNYVFHFFITINDMFGLTENTKKINLDNFYGFIKLKISNK